MTKFGYRPTALDPHPSCRLLVKALLPRCVSVAVSNLALAQTPVCPDPWATAKSVYVRSKPSQLAH
jgi:hypothetical protein